MSGSGRGRLLFALGCLCCLLLVASALPAADPRLETPGSVDGEPSATDWESIASTSSPQVDSDDDDDDDDDDEPDARTADIEIDGDIEPGNEVTVSVDDATFFDERTVDVNGESVGETHHGRIDVTVPYAESMTVSIDDGNTSTTVDVATEATIRTADGAAPNRDLEVVAVVGSTPVPDATVFLEGESVATTDDDGAASVRLPETAGPVDLRVERDPVAGERTVDVAEPVIEFTSPILFPGSPAPVQVSADGVGVPNATISLEGEPVATTDDDGKARVWLPIDDEATATVEVGAESASTTVGDLYLRLTAIVVFVPGFAIGGLITYSRLVSTGDGRRRNTALFIDLASALSGLFAGLSSVFDALTPPYAGRRPSWSLPSLPSLTLPRPDLGRGLAGTGTALSSLGSGLASLRLPSLGSLVRSSGESRRSGSLFGGRFGDDGDDESADAADGPLLAAEPLGPDEPRSEVRAAWHAFLDRLGIDRRETRTPGQAARTALAADFPATSVTRLVSIFRDVEYGGREASPDRVDAARTAANDLLEHRSDEPDEPDDSDESDEEGSE